jgi:hypothetical protein
MEGCLTKDLNVLKLRMQVSYTDPYELSQIEPHCKYGVNKVGFVISIRIKS